MYIIYPIYNQESRGFSLHSQARYEIGSAGGRHDSHLGKQAVAALEVETRRDLALVEAGTERMDIEAALKAEGEAEEKAQTHTVSLCRR
jgi:hypothetical protein